MNASEGKSNNTDKQKLQHTFEENKYGKELTQETTKRCHVNLQAKTSQDSLNNSQGITIQ